ncbi:hypothetical protein [Xenorhabdus bovienii]|uniref:hypothetical protein n=1 Tax=Xenorhabdus bovienii TaxID=40576 RepID=UPI0023B2A127|nr:hypothetical protein [Xenorhabdus bovienii]MDE9429850.1 hypothetical protein [Xenorhabdus bovienii]MDE9488012.1 hypothetical protein [Xenorhabdus bovienii]
MNSIFLGFLLIACGAGFLALIGYFVNSKDQVSKGSKNIRTSLLPPDLEKKRMIEREQTASLVSVPEEPYIPVTHSTDSASDPETTPGSIPD